MQPTTLTHPSAGPGASAVVLALPAQLSWSDEYTWGGVLQSTEYSTTGALVIDAWAKQAGRTITLSGAQDRAWCERGALNTLRTWATQPGQTFTLTLRGTARTVVFNHEGGALSAEPIIDFADPADTDPYAVTLRFLEL